MLSRNLFRQKHCHPVHQVLKVRVTLTALGASFTPSFPLCCSIASVQAIIALLRTAIPCSCPIQERSQFHFKKIKK